MDKILKRVPTPISMLFWISLATTGLCGMLYMHDGYLSPLLASIGVFAGAITAMLTCGVYICRCHIPGIPQPDASQRCVVCYEEVRPRGSRSHFAPGWPVHAERVRLLAEEEEW